MFTEVSLLHIENACLPISVTPSGRVIDVTFDTPAKACSPITFTGTPSISSGTIISFSALVEVEVISTYSP